MGFELKKILNPKYELISLNRSQLDLIDERKTRELIGSIKPNLIINATACNKVDFVERDNKEAIWVNGIVPGILAEEARKHNASIIHYSTDYVFDGSKSDAYVEDDQPNPINCYGKSKLMGETHIQQVDVPHLILRTSWAYGLRGNNFLLTILKLAKGDEKLRVVDDQVGAPTWSREIAKATTDIIAQGSIDITEYIKQYSGIYHLTASGKSTWYEFAKQIVAIYQKNTGEHLQGILPISSDEYRALASRPKNSLLSNQKLNKIFNIHMKDWKIALETAFQE